MQVLLLYNMIVSRNVIRLLYGGGLYKHDHTLTLSHSASSPTRKGARPSFLKKSSNFAKIF